MEFDFKTFFTAGHSSRVDFDQVDWFRPVIFENYLTRSDPTRDVSSASRPEQNLLAGVFNPPNVTRGPDHGP